MIKCVVCATDNRDTASFCMKCSLRLPGTVLQGRYKVSGVLGQGGMGAVYLVEDQSLFGTLWALKELRDLLLSPANRALAIQQFQREAQLLLGLAHPNLPKISHYFEENGRQHLVMEYIDGDTLETLCQTSAAFLPEAQIVDWAVQICEVLEYLHGHSPPVIFRDLKPANIMLASDGKVKLIDFGIARHFQPGKTQDTQMMGTPGYAAPEQYGGSGQSDARSDIYALGATLHHLLTRRIPGTPPFTYPACRTINSTVSAHIEAVVTKATEYDRARRYASANEVKLALQNTSAAPSGPASPSVYAATFVAPQAVVFGQTGPFKSFLAYRGVEKRVTTWIVEFNGNSCTCWDCGSQLKPVPQIVMQLYCSTCATQTTWTIYYDRIECVGCHNPLLSSSTSRVPDIVDVFDMPCFTCKAVTSWLIMNDSFGRSRLCLRCHDFRR